MDRVFVETTAQVTRLTGLRDVQSMIEHELAGHIVLTSSTVFLEFQRVVIDSHRRVLFTLDEVPDDGNGRTRLEDLYLALANSQRIASDRQAKRVLAVVASIQSRFGDDKYVSVDDLRAFINGEIRRFKKWRFFTFGRSSNPTDIRQSGGYLDSLECSVARRDIDPKNELGRMVTCNRLTRECAIRAFISEHRELIGTLASRLEVSDPKAADAAARVIGFNPQELDGRRAIGQRLCWPLADVLIALECPKDALLLTSDHHFDTICPAVGRSILYLDYLTGEARAQPRRPRAPGGPGE